MNNIIIGFSKPNHFNIISLLIQKIDGTNFSHAYVKWDTSFDRKLIYQASGTKVNFIGENLFLNKNKIVDEFKFTITPECRQKLIQYCVDNVGKPYGLLNLFGLCLYRLFNIRNVFTDNDNTLVCSELVGHIINDILHIPVEDLNHLTPGRLYEFVKSIKR